MTIEEQDIADNAFHDQFVGVVEHFLDHALTSPVATSPYLLAVTDTPIIAGYCIYRDDQFLRSSLDSICMYVNAVVLWEGRFLDFSELPRDNTYEIVSDVCSRFDPRWFVGSAMTQKFVYVDAEAAFGPMLEVEKRDLMFQTIRERGFLFIIDADEIAIGDVKAGLDFVRANPDKKIFWVYVEEDGNPGWKPRIIKVEDDMHYGVNHWTILDKKNELVTDSIYKENPEHAQITQFKIHNFKRTGKRSEERQAYRDILHEKKWNERKVAPK
ncbi:MAG: hypothetical protein ACYCPP_05680 [Nitrososphaerales archaeon]